MDVLNHIDPQDLGITDPPPVRTASLEEKTVGNHEQDDSQRNKEAVGQMGFLIVNNWLNNPLEF